MRFATAGRVIVVLGALCLCVACAGPVEVVHGLTESEANEVMVLLEGQGIYGKILAVEGEDLVTYTITVPPESASAARRILVANGIPRPTDPGYAEATAKTGMIPSASDEKMKTLHAKQGEINNALMAIDGVLSAKTLINLPETQTLSDGAPPPPTASVVLRLRRERKAGGEGFEEPPIDEDKVKRIVANAVQRLDASAVEVMTVAVTTDIPQPGAKARPGAAASGGSGKEGLFKVLAFGALGLVAVMALLLMLAAKQKKDLRRRVLALQRQIAEASGGGDRAPARKAAASRG